VSIISLSKPPQLTVRTTPNVCFQALSSLWLTNGQCLNRIHLIASKSALDRSINILNLITRVQTHSNPIADECSETLAGEKVFRLFVVSRGDTLEVLEASEHGSMVFRSLYRSLSKG
jgi:hypothetical protein